jgi:transcriptional regulator with XRE-family HTH domain
MDSTQERIAAEVRAECARQDKPPGRFVAEVLDIDEGSASRRVKGRRAFLAHELDALAKALNVPVGQFYGERSAA